MLVSPSLKARECSPRAFIMHTANHAQSQLQNVHKREGPQQRERREAGRGVVIMFMFMFMDLELEHTLPLSSVSDTLYRGSLSFECGAPIIVYDGCSVCSVCTLQCLQSVFHPSLSQPMSTHLRRFSSEDFGQGGMDPCLGQAPRGHDWSMRLQSYRKGSGLDYH